MKIALSYPNDQNLRNWLVWFYQEMLMKDSVRVRFDILLSR